MIMYCDWPPQLYTIPDNFKISSHLIAYVVFTVLSLSFLITIISNKYE